MEYTFDIYVIYIALKLTDVYLLLFKAILNFLMLMLPYISTNS